MQSVASPRGTLSEEQFQCSICLDIFVDPVSTPCGHSFCMACIRGYWNHSKACQCPMCKKTFPVRPELSVNRVLAEIAEQFQKGGQGRPDGSYAGPGEVSCDSCIGKKLKAAKSCLTCQASYCETHLRHHRKVKTLSKHRLVSPVYRLEEKLCKRHEKLLEGYCRTDQACVCALCVESGHKKHNVVPVEREWRKKLPQLGKKKAEVQQLIKERVKKMEDLKQALKIIKSSAQKEMEESWQVYSELMQAFERSQAEVVEAIEKKHKAAERQTEGLMRKLEQELSQLKRRNTELDQLLQTEDQVHFLQKFPTLGVLPEHTDWSDTTVQTDLYTGTVRKSVTQLVDRCQEILKGLHGKELKRIQNYAVDVTLDPDTAQCNLVLSEDGKQVRCEGKKQPLPDNPERFHKALFVLGREGFTSGRHYWEVEVGRKTAWTLGVAKESVNRKGDIKMSPESGYWCMWLKNGDGYKALSSTRVPLCLLSKPHRMGVYVDYEEGQVSFFDVTAEAHLFTFTDAFMEKLFPLFSPCINQDGRNAAPLAIPALH